MDSTAAATAENPVCIAFSILFHHGDFELCLAYWLAMSWKPYAQYVMYSNQSDSSISSISSREGPPRCELLFSPLEKIDLLYHPKSWKFRLKVKILSNKTYAKQLWSDLMYC